MSTPSTKPTSRSLIAAERRKEIADRKLKELEDALAKARVKAEAAAAAVTVATVKASTDRKQETRRKILIGALVLAEEMKDKKGEAAWLRRLDGFLRKDHERAVFGFPPLARKDPASSDGTESEHA